MAHETVVVVATTSEEARDYARRLLDAADNPADVTTITHVDGVMGFEVSEKLAAAAGFGDPDNPGDPNVPAPAATVAEAPGRNASRAQWVAFLDAQDPPVEHTADASRDELVALWDERTK